MNIHFDNVQELLQTVGSVDLEALVDISKDIKAPDGEYTLDTVIEAQNEALEIAHDIIEGLLNGDSKTTWGMQQTLDLWEEAMNVLAQWNHGDPITYNR